MKQFLITAAGVFAGLLIFLVGVPFILVSMAAGAAGPPALPVHAVLELDLREPLTDQSPQGVLAGLGRRGLSVMSIVEGLQRAERDGRVKGLLIRLPESGLEPAAADEIRQAIHRFRRAGKPVFAHSQGLYPAGVITSTYLVGAAADQLWMQPGASFQVTGLANEDLFLKRFFDRYGIRADYQQRAEYKNAVNGYLYSDYTAAHREAQLSWMNAIYADGVASAAVDRKRDAPGLKAVLEAGPYLAEDALRLGLVDRLGQVREAEDVLLKQAGDKAETVEFSDFVRNLQDRPRPGPAIALIEAEGPIVTGRGRGANPFSSGSTIYSDELADAIGRAVEADNVKAIVLRLNSPGGSDTASEQILDAIREAKAKKKPVVVSMGAYAASGGYWIASQASAIVAQPSTLTGSIGVFGGKFAFGPALERYGVDVRQLQVGGPYAGAFGAGESFTPEQRAALSRWMDRIYDGFVARVAAGRHLPVERVREIARGRVWTGAQAKELGLVDELGGLYQAVAKAKALAGLHGDVALRRMTPADTPIEAIQKALGISAMSARALAAAAWVLGDPRASALLDSLGEARLRAQDSGMVLAPLRAP